VLPNRATTVETSLASHIVTIPSLFSPPPPSTTTTTTCRRRQVPRLTPTFGPTRGELVDTHATQDRHVTAYNPLPLLPPPPPHLDCHHRHVTTPLDPQHHLNHRHVTQITATSPKSPPRHPTTTTTHLPASPPTSRPPRHHWPTTTMTTPTPTPSATSPPIDQQRGDRGRVGGDRGRCRGYTPVIAPLMYQ